MCNPHVNYTNAIPLDLDITSCYVVACIFSIDSLPSTTQLIVVLNIVFISWNSSWDEYLIEEYSRSDDLSTIWTTCNRINTPYNLNNATEEVKISICPIISFNITVGKTSNFYYIK